MQAASTWLYIVVDVGVLERHRVEGALPEVAREREHVGLVHEREVLARTRPGQLERVPDAPLDAHAGVHRALGGDLVGRALPQEPALARVHAFGVLADDDEVDVGVAGVGRGDERAVVHVEIELEAQPQQDPALHDPSALAGGGAHRAEEHRVELADGLEVFVGEDRAVALVALPTEVERRRLVADAGRVEALDGLGDDLGADAVSPDDPDAIGHFVFLRSWSRQRGRSVRATKNRPTPGLGVDG